jgi:hypothetical protein
MMMMMMPTMMMSQSRQLQQQQQQEGLKNSDQLAYHLQRPQVIPLFGYKAVDDRRDN